MRQIFETLGNFFLRMAFRCIKNRRVGIKSVEQIKWWLEEHGIERSTAALIDGFLRAHDIRLTGIRLCSHGVTYSFDEFLKWFQSDDGYEPLENEFAIFWNHSHAEAVVGVFAKMRDGRYVDVAGRVYDNAIDFKSLADYRMILNVPDDAVIPLPLEHLNQENPDYIRPVKEEKAS